MVSKCVAPTNRKFQPQPTQTLANQKCWMVPPDNPITAAVLESSKPASRTFNNPHFLMSEPVKKDGANMPNMCHCAMNAESSNVCPNSRTMASGVAAIINTITLSVSLIVSLPAS